MRTTTASLGLLLVAAFACADGIAQIHSTSMRPSLVALQVGNLDASVRWYTTYLGFQQKEKRDFPDQKLKLAILNLQDFDIELVENAKTLRKAEALSGKATDITGFAKVTFTVDNVAALFQLLTDKGADFAVKLRPSNIRPGEQSFVVLDNEGNWLQFVGKK
jgi:catechol 2,3-dioxygenase-like lactoylglutathione lyase family enzyme